MIELVLCTLIWGGSFIAQKLGAGHFGPFALNAFRDLLAGAVLCGVLMCRDRRAFRTGWNRATLLGGALSGVFVCAAELAQQLGVERTTPGVAAFLTTNYVLLVPVFALFLRRRAGLGVWGGVALAMGGTYLICLGSGEGRLAIGPGEAWTLLCAALFALQILVVDRYVGMCDLLRFSAVQVAVAGLIDLPFVLLPGEMTRLSRDGFVQGLPALLYLGILTGALAYVLQNRGQAKVPAASAAIVLSLEGVFAALFGWLVLGDALSVRQLVGCALILSAVVFSQLVHPSCRKVDRGVISAF